jgi:hypothetical protein
LPARAEAVSREIIFIKERFKGVRRERSTMRTKRSAQNRGEFRQAIAVSAAVGFLCFGFALAAAQFVGR